MSQSSYNYDRYIREYSQFNEADFLEEVGTIDWMDVFGDTDDINLIFSSFFDTLSVLVDKHVPLKKLSKRKAQLLSKPWIKKYSSFHKKKEQILQVVFEVKKCLLFF